MEAFMNSDGGYILIGMADKILNSANYLTEDTKTYDRQLVCAQLAKIGQSYLALEDPVHFTFAEGLYELGTILLNKLGQTLGAFYGTLFMDMADSIENADSIGLWEFINAVRAGQKGLAELVNSRTGESSLTDTLSPVVTALKGVHGESSFCQGLENMKVMLRNASCDDKMIYGKVLLTGMAESIQAFMENNNVLKSKDNL